MTTTPPALKWSTAQAKAIANANGRANIWEGAVRSGKTFSSIIAFCLKIATWDGPGIHVITGRNRDSIYRNFFSPIFTTPELEWLAATVKYRQGAPTATILGKPVAVIGASDNSAETKIKGATVAIAYVDEITVLPESFFKMTLSRLSLPGSQLLGTTNPDSPTHWLKTEYLDRLDELHDWRDFKFTLDDNPVLTEEYKNALKVEYTGLWYARYIEGKWVAAEGAIYDMWNPQTHVIKWENLPQIAQTICIGMDYGTTNPTDAVMLAQDLQGNLYAIDEWRATKTAGNLTDSEISDQFRTWLYQTPHLPAHQYGTNQYLDRPRYIFIDPAAASMKTQLYNDGLRNIRNADNDVLAGIKLTASGLTEGWLKISNRCTWLLKEFPSYAWDPKATEEGNDRPIKQADHALDALRYALASTETIWRRHLPRNR